jgi:hypothetical protein
LLGRNAATIICIGLEDGILTIKRNVPEAMERLPGDSLRVLNPILV